MERSQQASAQWRPRKYVLLGMGAILAASTLIIITSIILQPANIQFFITNFSDNCQTDAGDKKFTFSLISDNPSHRAEVVYSYVLVSMQLKNNGRPRVRKMSVAANIIKKDEFVRPQKRNSIKTTYVEAIVDSQFIQFYGCNASVMMMVFAQAQFKVGFARSRVYNIRSACEPFYLMSVNGSQQYSCSTVS